jgi:capsular exopolysaccharide synthesis family protein
MQVPFAEDRNSDTINIVKYLVLLWHWAWLIILAFIIAGGAAYLISKLIPPVYQAKTTVLVDMAPSNKLIDYSSLQLSSQLTQTYSQMITKSPVLDEVAKRLGLVAVDPKTVSAKPVTSTQLITILTESTNPQKAADIANMMVTVFADQVQSLQASRFSESEESLQTQMADIQTKLKESNDQLAVTTDATEKDRLETMIANYSQTYSSLLQSFEQVRLSEAQTASSIVQIEPAIVPDAPIRPRIFLNVAVASLASAVLVCAIVIGLDLMNDTVKTPEEISSKLGLPVLGAISHHSRNENGPITESQPLSPISEAFRTLRTNVKYAGAGLQKPLRSILVTSAQPGEGKTEILVNLGIVLAQNKMRVLLMDADLRRPALHRRLELDNLIGLSQVFVHPELGMSYSFQPTRINGLSAITSGDTPPNPSELLGSQLMGTIMGELKNTYDIILIDTPPALAVTDAAVLLPYIDGVLLVIKPGVTNMAAIQRLVGQFRQLNAYILGVVLNDINLSNSTYGFYYKHYKYYDEYQSKDAKKTLKQKRIHRTYDENGKVIKNPVRQVIRSLVMLFRNV